MEAKHGKKVLIIGAGLGGLSCAHSLLAAGVDVTVCETASQAGGVVGSIERNGFCFETGPHTVLPSALMLVSESTNVPKSWLVLN